MLVGSTKSKSISLSFRTPSDASCSANWRPMAPTPMTVTSNGASTFRGTKSSCRANRFSEGCIDGLQSAVGVGIYWKTLEPGVAEEELLFTGPAAEKINGRPGDRRNARPLRLGPDQLPVLGFPGGRVGTSERLLKIDLDRQNQLTAGT